jgi:hypothetical protein
MRAASGPAPRSPCPEALALREEVAMATTTDRTTEQRLESATRTVEEAIAALREAREAMERALGVQPRRPDLKLVRGKADDDA